MDTYHTSICKILLILHSYIIKYLKTLLSGKSIKLFFTFTIN